MMPPMKPARPTPSSGRKRRLAGRAIAFLLLAGVAGCGTKLEGEGPDAWIRRGWALFRLGDYRPALEHFDAALAAADLDAESRLQALYGKAIVWDQRQPVPAQDDEQAEALYREVIAANPDHDLAAWSRLALARMQHLVPVDGEPDMEAALAAYQDVIDHHPRHPAGQEALVRREAAILMSLDPDRTRTAAERLEAFIAEQPDSPFRSAAHGLLAQAYETLQDPERQLEHLRSEIDTMEVDPASPDATDRAWNYWMAAVTAEFQAGRFDAARIYYRKLIEEYPLDYRKFGAKQALLRMDRIEARLRAGEAP